MPTIRNEFRKARKFYICDSCDKAINKGDEHNYIFGYAELGDKPRALRFCMKCINKAKWRDEE